MLPSLSANVSSSATSRSGDAAGSSYNIIDNSMVVGGGGSLTKGALGTPAGEAYTNTVGTPTWLLPAMIGMGVIVAFLAFKR